MQAHAGNLLFHSVLLHAGSVPGRPGHQLHAVWTGVVLHSAAGAASRHGLSGVQGRLVQMPGQQLILSVDNFLSGGCARCS